MENNTSKYVRPRYILPLILLTLIYLFIESGFNACLLDIVGSNSTPKEIDDIEVLGRIISGIAVALAICGSFVFPRLFKKKASFFAYSFSTIIIFVIFVPVVFFGEKKLIEKLTDSSSSYDRKIATLISLTSNQLKRGDLFIDGMSFDATTIGSAEGKTFTTLFGILVLNSKHGFDRLKSNSDLIIQQEVRSAVGSVENFYNDNYINSLNVLNRKYKTYQDAVDLYRSKLKKLLIDSDDAWDQYIIKLQRKGYSPQTLPRSQYAKIRSMLRKEGIPVSDNWHPASKQEFKIAYENQAKKSLSKRLESKLQNLSLPKNFPLNLVNFNQFLANGNIQFLWKKQLSLPDSSVLYYKMPFKDFEKLTFKPLLNELTANQKKIVNASIADFDDGNKYSEVGKNAYKSIIVAPLALFLSLLGLIIHICKLCYLIIRVFLPSSLKVLIFNAIFCSILLISPFFVKNNLTNSFSFIFLEKTVKDDNYLLSESIRWVIQGQTFTYPINSRANKLIFNSM